MPTGEFFDATRNLGVLLGSYSGDIFPGTPLLCRRGLAKLKQINEDSDHVPTGKADKGLYALAANKREGDTAVLASWYCNVCREIFVSVSLVSFLSGRPELRKLRLTELVDPNNNDACSIHRFLAERVGGFVRIVLEEKGSISEFTQTGT